MIVRMSVLGVVLMGALAAAPAAGAAGPVPPGCKQHADGSISCVSTNPPYIDCAETPKVPGCPVVGVPSPAEQEPVKATKVPAEKGQAKAAK